MFTERTFRNMIFQAMLGDFLQLNPVKSHSLLGTFIQNSGIRIPGVPSYEHLSHADKQAKLQQIKKGYDVFDKACENVVLHTGAHRFVAGHALTRNWWWFITSWSRFKCCRD